MSGMRVSVTEDSVRLVAETVDLLLDTQDVAAARSHLAALDLAALWHDRKESLAKVRGIPGDEARPRHAISRSRALEVHERNHFTCRYDRCSFTTALDEDVLKTLGTLGALDYYRQDRTPQWHILALTVMAAPEHVVPRSTDPRDWTTACWTCNSVKSDRRLEDLGWRYDPEPPSPPWMGLRDRLPELERLVRISASTLVSPSAAEVDRVAGQ